MEAWKRRLYDRYVSSGHFAAGATPDDCLPADRNPYAARLIRRHLPAARDISIVDLGCGNGALLSCLQQFGYRQICGVDTSQQQVAAARASGLTDVECKEIGAFLMGKENRFDVVFLMDILEHLRKSELLGVLDQVRAALKVDGLLILHVPNAEGVFGMRVRYGDLTHENAFTPQSIHQALRVCGFDQITCYEDKPIVHGPTSLVRRMLWACLTTPMRLLLSAETGVTGHILSQNMTVVARTRQPGIK